MGTYWSGLWVLLHTKTKGEKLPMKKKQDNYRAKCKCMGADNVEPREDLVTTLGVSGGKGKIFGTALKV